MAAPFASPCIVTADKPVVQKWIPPQPTKARLEWAELRTIELSLLDSPDPDVVANLVATTKAAIKDDGFLFLTDYGVSLEQLHRQFDLTQYLHANISEADKARLHWDPSTGVFAGFKPRFGWKREKGSVDGIEHFNFYSPEFADNEKVPKCILPFMDEISAFCDYLMNSVNKRLLALLSMVLELPRDYLWDNVQSHDGLVGDGYFRHALYYPLEGEAKRARKGVRMYGQTYRLRHNNSSLLCPRYSFTDLERREVEVRTVQAWSFGNNLGETLEVISGGHFKATLHKVAEPPKDQENEPRLSLVFFNGSKGDMRLKPIADSPLIQREGFVLKQGVFMQFKKLIDAGVPVPTNKEWREAQVSTRVQASPEEKLVGVKDVNGTKYGEDIILGVPIVLPV